jgi:hypothetical protein
VVSESASEGVVDESTRETEEYVRWLERESMLANASAIAGQFSGVGEVWQSPFAIPNPAAAMAKSSVWFTAYPISMTTRPGHSFLSTLGDDELWLAEMGVGDYPGIYHMVEIPPEDWHLLPEVLPGKDSVNLDSQAEGRLQQAGYIVGRLQRVIFHDPGTKDTNWSATAPVTGPDGVERRWVYLHYFKDGQPSINWLDPTFAGMRLVIGDALHSLGHLGAGALRLDANGFLGVERSAEGDAPAWSEGHGAGDLERQISPGHSLCCLRGLRLAVGSTAWWRSGQEERRNDESWPIHSWSTTGRWRSPTVAERSMGGRTRWPGSRGQSSLATATSRPTCR